MRVIRKQLTCFQIARVSNLIYMCFHFSVYTQATRVLESVALAMLFVTTVCLIFYVGLDRSRTRGMAVAIMIIALIAGIL